MDERLSQKGSIARDISPNGKEPARVRVTAVAAVGCVPRAQLKVGWFVVLSGGRGNVRLVDESGQLLAEGILRELLPSIDSICVEVTQTPSADPPSDRG